MILVVQAYAAADGDIGSHCDDGFGDDSSYGYSEGTHYTVLNNPGNQIVETYSPVAYGTGDYYSYAEAKLITAAYGVTLDYAGTVADANGHPSLLVGQQFDATVNFGGLSPDPSATYTWSVSPPGSPFSSWTVAGSTATYSGPSYGTGQKMTAYFAANSDSIPVSCTISAPTWGLSNIPVTGAALRSVAPAVDILNAYFTPLGKLCLATKDGDGIYHANTSAPTYIALLQPPDVKPGMQFQANVIDPGSPWTDGSTKIGTWYFMADGQSELVGDQRPRHEGLPGKRLRQRPRPCAVLYARLAMAM